MGGAGGGGRGGYERRGRSNRTAGSNRAARNPGAAGKSGRNGGGWSRGDELSGAWVTGTGYAANDAVTFGSPASTYIAQSGNTSQEPDNYPGVWTVIAQAGGTGSGGAVRPGGAAATVSVGTVNTGAAGGSASVTNIGTSSAAILNFTIPQGATGRGGKRRQRGRQQRDFGRGDRSYRAVRGQSRSYS